MTQAHLIKRTNKSKTTHKRLLFVLFFMLKARFLAKKAQILLNFTPPKPFCLNNSFFMHNFATRKKLQRFAHIGNSVFRKSYLKNAYVFIATANQTKLKKKTSAKGHPQLRKKHQQLPIASTIAKKFLKFF